MSETKKNNKDCLDDLARIVTIPKAFKTVGDLEIQLKSRLSQIKCMARSKAK